MKNKFGVKKQKYVNNLQCTLNKIGAGKGPQRKMLIKVQSTTILMQGFILFDMLAIDIKGYYIVNKLLAGDSLPLFLKISDYHAVKITLTLVQTSSLKSTE